MSVVIRLFIVPVLLILFTAMIGYSQTDDIVAEVESQQQAVDSQSEELDKSGNEFLETFRQLNASYLGNTENCKGYKLFAIRCKKVWFLAINVNNSPEMSLFVQNPPRSEEKFIQVSSFVVQGVSSSITNNYIKKKRRRKRLKDLRLNGFYKMRKPGKRVAKGILLVEFPKLMDKAPEFFLFKPIYDLFTKSAEESEKDDEGSGIREEVEEKLNSGEEEGE